LRGAEARKFPQALQGITSMTALLIENLKLIVLFTLIVSIIGLSNLSGRKAKPVHRKAHRDYGSFASTHL
jgi:hypothetical protein